MLAATRVIFRFFDETDISSFRKFFLSFSMEYEHYFFMLFAMVIVGGFVLPYLLNRIPEYLRLPQAPVRTLYAFDDLPFLYRVRYRLFCTQKEMLDIDALKRGDFATLMLAQSCYEKRVIELVLTNDDIYIGFVITPVLKETPRADDPNDILFIPVVKHRLSGEENPTVYTREIKEYLHQLDQGEKPGASIQDIAILISRSSVVSIRFFPFEEPDRADTSVPRPI